MQMHARGAVELGKKTIRSWTRMRRVHAAMIDALEAGLRREGLPQLAWYGVLDELERGPEIGLRPFELQAILGEEQYQMSRLLDRIVRAGLIEKVACADDGRGFRIRIAEPGRAVRAKMWGVHVEVLSERIVGKLGDKQIKQLDGVLGDMLRAADEKR